MEERWREGWLAAEVGEVRLPLQLSMAWIDPGVGSAFKKYHFEQTTD